jgi:hypothetical protein
LRRCSRPLSGFLSYTLGTVSVSAAALLLCLLALGQPARAQTVITTDTVINYSINDNVSITCSPTVSLVPSGSILYGPTAYDASTVTITGDTFGKC